MIILDAASHYWSTQHPLFYLAFAAAMFLGGFALGFRGYTKARFHGCMDFIRARQRSRLVMEGLGH